MNFGQALEALKAGHRAVRAGWNGKGMYLIKIQGSNDIASLYGYGFNEYLDELAFADTIYLKSAQNQLVAWNPSQVDMLAEDWEILE